MLYSQIEVICSGAGERLQLAPPLLRAEVELVETALEKVMDKLEPNGRLGALSSHFRA